jgi:hypothetical protein
MFAIAADAICFTLISVSTMVIQDFSTTILTAPDKAGNYISFTYSVHIFTQLFNSADKVASEDRTISHGIAIEGLNYMDCLVPHNLWT